MVAIFQKTNFEKKKKILMLGILAIYSYISSFTQIQQFQIETVLKKTEIPKRTISPGGKQSKLINKQNNIFMLYILVIYTYISSFMQIQQTCLDLKGFSTK